MARRRKGGFGRSPKLGLSATTAPLQRALTARPRLGPTNTQSGLRAGLASRDRGPAAALHGAGGKPHRTKVGRTQARTKPEKIGRLGFGKS